MKDQDRAAAKPFDFTGKYEHVLEPNGRLTLPVVYREQLERALPAKYDPHLILPCIVIYPLPIWYEFRAKLDVLPGNNEGAEDGKDFFMSYAFNCELDAQGRTHIPGELRTWAKIDRDVWLVGKGTRIEVWQSDEYERHCKERDVTLRQRIKEFSL